MSAPKKPNVCYDTGKLVKSAFEGIIGGDDEDCNELLEDVSRQPNKIARVRYLWNENMMKAFLQQARGQQIVIQTLLAALQS